MKTILLLMTLTAAAQGNFGGNRTHANEPGLNRSIADYQSCVTKLADLGDIALFVGKNYREPIHEPVTETVETEVEGKRLLLGFLPGVILGSMVVVEVVPQQLVLRWVDGFHKSTQSEAHFGGLYVLYPIAPGDTARVSFFRRWDVPVIEILSEPQIRPGAYGLVPVSQIAALEAALNEDL